jgi:hypothetical protein
MKEILNTKPSTLPKNLYSIGDLVVAYYPLHSLYRDDRGSLYMCSWVERDDSHSRWLLYEVSLNSLGQYIKAEISHLDLLKTALNDYICFDVDVNEVNSNIVKCTFESLPISYIPKSTAYFSESASTDIEYIRQYFEENKFKSTPMTVSYKKDWLNYQAALSYKNNYQTQYVIVT